MLNYLPILLTRARRYAEVYRSLVKTELRVEVDYAERAEESLCWQVKGWDTVLLLR
jgi:hypothetical protein